MKFDEFIAKVREKENNKVKSTEIEIKDIGKVTFIRPSESIILKFNNNLAKCYRGNIHENENIGVENVDIELMSSISSEFVYNSCPFFKEKELREMYKEYEFYDIPLIVFGNDEVIRVAVELNNIFKGIDLKKEIEDDIKK